MRPSEVSISPGTTRLTRTTGAPSTAALRHTASSAALDAAYAGIGIDSRPASEPMSTTEPPSGKRSSASLQPRKWLRRLIASTRSQSSTLVPPKPIPPPTPTFITRPSRPPAPAVASSNTRVSSPSSAASPTAVTAEPPSPSTSSAVARALSPSMSATATAAPSRASSNEIARPLPIGGSGMP